MHIDATLQEIRKLRDDFPEVTIVGVSDSAFHTEKPDFTWNYGLPLYDTDRLEIKRFGYHGISLAAVVRNLRRLEKLSAKLIVCHIGSTVSVTALHESRSVDTTMGFSPLDGLVMATRSGSVDPAAILYLKRSLDLDDSQLELYLNEQSGLQGLSCTSSDISDLLSYESEDHRAALALQVYVYGIQKAIGQMTAAVGGVDMLVFTGVVGERSAIIRERILKPFHYLDLMLDAKENSECVSPSSVTCISHLAHSRPIYVIPTDEADEIARRANDMS
jgi:acetate kinase